MKSNINYFANSFLWNTIAKISNALVQFISIPILLIYFGRDNYGLIALAMAVNTYLQLLDLGINTGAVKFFSEWIQTKNHLMLERVARTSISFYGIIGVINAIILVIIAYKGLHLFSLDLNQADIFRTLLLILAAFSIINWCSSVLNQLLIANEDISYIQKVLTIKSLLILVLTYGTVYKHLTITSYFLIYTLINSILILPFFYKRLLKSELLNTFKPAFYWQDFSKILKYSIAILSMSIFQISAIKLRPVILNIFSGEGSGIIADYQILETITLLVISIGGSLTAVFLPKTTKLYMSENKEEINDFIYRGTKYTSILATILCVPILLCSKEIIELYVGTDYIHLYLWLNIWIFTILMYIHNTPVASLVLSSGKTKMLVYSSAIACIISLLFNMYFAAPLGIGASVIGYLIYIVIQMSFYYIYFNNKVLKTNSLRVFKEFIKPTSIALLIALGVWMLDLNLSNSIIQILVKSLIWFTLYFILLFGVKIIGLKDIQSIINK